MGTPMNPCVAEPIVYVPTITPLGLIPMTIVLARPVTSTWTGAESPGFCRKP